MDVSGGLFCLRESLIPNRMDVNGGLEMSHSVFNPIPNLIDAQTEWPKQNGGPIYLCRFFCKDVFDFMMPLN